MKPFRKGFFKVVVANQVNHISQVTKPAGRQFHLNQRRQVDHGHAANRLGHLGGIGKSHRPGSAASRISSGDPNAHFNTIFRSVKRRWRSGTWVYLPGTKWLRKSASPAAVRRMFTSFVVCRNRWALTAM